MTIIHTHTHRHTTTSYTAVAQRRAVKIRTNFILKPRRPEKFRECRLTDVEKGDLIKESTRKITKFYAIEVAMGFYQAARKTS